MRYTLTFTLFFSLIASNSLFSATQNLDETKIQKAVNEVYLVDSETLSERPVQQGDILNAPDMIKTGRRSRVELVADDGTITRVGANTIFSFKPNSRNMSLQQGNVLFHSPPGRGGGTIASGAASASVLGTTIAVSATPNGGFKLLCLEGVVEINFPNGQTRVLNAGQLTFVLPPTTEGLQTNQPIQNQEDPPAGEPGPVLDFDLEAQTEGSSLIIDFDNPLPSIGKINDAIGEQQIQISEGTLGETGLAILDATDKESILIIKDRTLLEKRSETDSTTPTTEPTPSQLTALQRAIISSVTLPGTINTDNIIATNIDLSGDKDLLTRVSSQTTLGSTSVTIFANTYASNFAGFLSGNLTLSGTVSLQALNNGTFAPSAVNILTLGAMSLKGDVSINGLNTRQTLYLSAIRYVFGGGTDSRNKQLISLRPDNSGTSTSIQSLETFKVSNFVNIKAGSNNLFITTIAGDIDISNSDASGRNLSYTSSRTLTFTNARSEATASQTLSSAGNTTLKDSTLTASGALSIESTKGSTTLNNATLSSNGAISLKGNTGMNISNSSLTASSASIIKAGGGTDLTIDSTSLNMQILNVGQFASTNAPGTTNALNQVALNNLASGQLSSIQTLSIAARTVNLQNVHFPTGSTVRLYSENGQSNFGSIEPLHVNFISNVTHAGNNVTPFDINPGNYNVNIGGVFVQRLSDGAVLPQLNNIAQ